MNQKINETNPVSKNIRVIAAAVVIITVIVGGGIYRQKNHLGLINKESIPYVSWDEAVKILNSGQVKEVIQTVHNLEVALILKDDTSVKTVESRLDEIVDAKIKCGPLCNEILFSLK